MINMKVSANMTLLEVCMSQGGFPTNTRARKAIKGGFVTVNGEVNRIPSTALEPGTAVTYNPQAEGAASPRPSVVDFDLGAAPKQPKSTPPPFEVVYEDDYLLAYIKPAGWVFASPNPKVKTSYTRMKDWMSQARPDCFDVHFVNRIEKESSGICFIAKDLQWRVHLQKHWGTYEQGLYVVVEGHLPADDEIFAFQDVEGSKKRDRVSFPYRTMRATTTHTMLKFQVGFDDIPALLSGLRRAQCMIIGKGELAPDPIGRSGLHLYQVTVQGPEGELVEAKSRVPREFLNLMKGGKGPRARSAAELAADKRRKSEARDPKSGGRDDRRGGPRDDNRPRRADGPRTEGRPHRADGPRTEGRPHRADGPRTEGRPQREDRNSSPRKARDNKPPQREKKSNAESKEGGMAPRRFGPKGE
jgi:23S rRNA-/tRNA-specific pseudouridylate synthase